MVQRAERITNSTVSASLCLVVSESHDRDQVRFITQLPEIVIGRSAECDILLEGATVSRIHCVLKRVSSGYLAEDCSRNGTWVNGMRIRTCLLRDGDQIRIGTHLLRVEVTTARPTTQSSGRETGSGYLSQVGQESEQLPQIFVRGLEEGVTLSLCGNETTIGRHPSCDIWLEGEKVSRDHSLIRRIGSTFVLIDPGSANGTYVNGRRIEKIELTDGDQLRIGDYNCLVSFRDRDCLLQFRKKAN